MTFLLFYVISIVEKIKEEDSGPNLLELLRELRTFFIQLIIIDL